MPASKKQSMQSTAYDFIKKKITTCEYAPNQMLSESLLQAELGFSRTPVREAISRLAQEGLLKVFPKRGIVVSGFTFSDINMIFEVRTLVEPYTLLNYGIKLNLDEIARFSKRLQAECAASFDSSFYQVDDEFHSMLVAVLPNVYLRELYNRIQTQNIRLRIMSGQHTANRLAETNEEHLQILSACLAQDWQAAAQAMALHLQRSKEASLAALMQGDVSAQII
ncbi:MAG: GntR family transcriptional regulator [Agathobaculum sp.]|jgi:DNA-binding GntR family transcriptional regulator|uniref:GntR family transcriptional regulator n=1 Tax=Agathobaculum sp. TaxID=2048138 RepID=UPI003D9222F1